MRSLIGAAMIAALLLVGYCGAPLVPVAVGIVAAGAWTWWRRGGALR